MSFILKKPKSLKTAANLMPTDTYSIKILEERSRLLFEKKEKKEISTNIIHYVQFILGKDEHYGLPYAHANEIIPNTGVTKVPFSKKNTEGVINHRGKLITIINLGKILNLTEENNNDYPYILVAHEKDQIIGFYAKDIIGGRYYHPEELTESIHYSASRDSNYIKGLHHGSIAILNLETIINDINNVI